MVFAASHNKLEMTLSNWFQTGFKPVGTGLDRLKNNDYYRSFQRQSRVLKYQKKNAKIGTSESKK